MTDVIMRGGRFDLKISMDAFNETEIRQLLTLMFKDITDEKDMEYLMNTPLQEDEFTPVSLVNLAQKYHNLRRVVDKVKARPEDNDSS